MFLAGHVGVCEAYEIGSANRVVTDATRKATT